MRSICARGVTKRTLLYARRIARTVYAEEDGAGAKAVLDDPAIYPTPEAMENTFTTTPWDPKVQREVTRLWTKIKSGT